MNPSPRGICNTCNAFAAGSSKPRFMVWNANIDGNHGVDSPCSFSKCHQKSLPKRDVLQESSLFLFPDYRRRSRNTFARDRTIAVENYEVILYLEPLQKLTS